MSFLQYVVDLAGEDLRDAPTLWLDEADRPRDRAYYEAVAGCYGRLRCWGL